MFVWLIVFIVCLSIFGTFEARALMTGRPTLSRTVWRVEARYPILAFAVGALFGGLAIHFFGFLPACNP